MVTPSGRHASTTNEKTADWLTRTHADAKPSAWHPAQDVSRLDDDRLYLILDMRWNLMRQSIWLAALAPFLCLVAGSSAEAAPPDEQPPLRRPPEPRDGDVNVSYWGTVTELTKTSITIRFDNQRDHRPKIFLASETLAAGKFATERRMKLGKKTGHSVSPVEMYRLTDVKTGDWVLISYAHLDGVDTCDHICIQKRPGGRVPPLPKGAENLEPPVPLIEG